MPRCSLLISMLSLVLSPKDNDGSMLNHREMNAISYQRKGVVKIERSQVPLIKDIELIN